MVDDERPRRVNEQLAHEKLAAATADEKSATSRGKVSALLVGVDDEIEQMRERMLKILMDDPSPDIPVRSGQLLEELVLNLRQANEHLVIASLDASTRETNAAEAHRRQTLFLSMLAHELRNPLAPIVMSVQLLGEIAGVTPAIASLQRILARQTQHLTRLVADLMDATRINSGKIHIHKTSALLSQVMAQAVETSQLFSNLILNASKFSPDRSNIELSARLEAEHVVISVKDHGIGIAPDLQPFIF